MNAMTEIAAPAAIEPGTIRVNARDLRRVVAQVGVVVQRRTSIPVLACLLIRPGKDKLEISGTDLDTLITMECPAECGKKAAAYVIQAELLKKLLAGTEADETVEITRSDANDVLTLRIGPAVAQVRELRPVEDFPPMAELQQPEARTVPIGVGAVEVLDSVGFHAAIGDIARDEPGTVSQARALLADPHAALAEPEAERQVAWLVALADLQHRRDGAARIGGAVA